jgi:putative selenate reductase
MPRLRPYPFAALVRRAFRELDERQTIFDLPARAFFFGDPRTDLSVRVHGHAASTPFGPAAGPQSQLAQNIVLSWLGGGRVVELKTVQVNDALSIPRPCIDVQTVGYNIEWSQELKIEESLEEYAKASMLVEMLVASGKVPLAPAAPLTIYDMSVGYDFAGITSERVQAFIRGMLDARILVQGLRSQIPHEYRQYRDVDFSTRLSDTLTLSTFHGCPPGEIEKIVEFLLRDVGLHVTIKLNPTLPGSAETRRLLHDVLGYHGIRVPDRAFDRDTTWDQAVGLVDRLATVAADAGRGVGVKFTNTLIVENHRTFFPADQAEMYLSGPPLHVLAMHLVRRFRRELGDRFPISFSGGIDRVNFADAAALGLVPVTVCTDLLKPGGYARARGYLQSLIERMDAVGAGHIGDFIIRAYGLGEDGLARLGPHDDRVSRACRDALAGGTDLRQACGESFYARWLSEVTLLNTERYVERATADPRYGEPGNRKTPRKIGRSLRLFDCLSCDKCVPVCPNDANFTFVLPVSEFPIVKLRREGNAWQRWEEGTFRIAEPHQIGNFADFCNDCGNCDVFCPEDGGPYVLKPRVFGSRDAWENAPALDGFFLDRDGGRETVLGRFGGDVYRLQVGDGQVVYSGAAFAVTFAESDPAGTIEGEASAIVDLTYFQIMNALRKAILAPSEVNYVTALFQAPPAAVIPPPSRRQTPR